MKNLSFKLAAASALTLSVTHGQVILEQSAGSYDAYSPVRRPAPLQDRTVNLGSVGVDAIASLGVTYDDNIRYSENDQLEDFSIEPGIRLNAFWPMTEFNALTLSLGASYRHYFTETDYDRFYLTPGSRLSFYARVAEFWLNVYDDFSYSTDPFDVGSAVGFGSYGGMQNTAGLNVSRDFGLFAASLGYSHYNYWSTETVSDSETRAIDSFFLRAPFRPGEGAFIVGPEASLSFARYDLPIHNDSDSWSLGAFVSWDITDYITLTPRGGWSQYSFDDNGLIGGGGDSGQFYADITVAHQINARWSHRLTFGRNQRLSTYSDLLDQWEVTYGISARPTDKWTLGLDVTYENGDDEGGGLEEQSERFWVGARVSREIIRKLGASLSYRFTRRDSDLAGRDYTQNVVDLSLTYRF